MDTAFIISFHKCNLKFELFFSVKVNCIFDISPFNH